MMEQKNSEWEITITPQAGVPEAHWNDPLLIRVGAGPAGVLDLLRDFKKGSDIKELKMEHLADNRYLWYFLHSDGREWAQEIRIADPLPTTAMNFDIPDFWQIKELKGARGSLVAAFVTFFLKYPTEMFEVEWLM